MRKIYIYPTLLALSLSIFSCTQDQLENSVSTNLENKATIINSSKGAVEGRILVKFNSQATGSLDAAASDTNNTTAATSSGITSVDHVLEQIDAERIERIFPLDKRREALTRQSSLHLWYAIYFDESRNLDEVARLLSSISDINKIEFSHTIQPIHDQERDHVGYYQNNTTFNSTRSNGGGFNDPMYSAQWGLSNDGTIIKQTMTAGADIKAEAAWSKCSGDPSIIVAVLDQGVMYDHPDLIDNIWVNEGEEIGAGTDADGNGYVDDKHGYNFVGNKGTILHGTGSHGTHVAGIVSAVNNNNEGISSIAGGSGNGDGVKIMICQITYGLPASLEEEAKAIKYAADNGATILQCSWGIASGAFDDDKEWSESHWSIEKEALDYFIKNAGSPSGVIDGGLAIFASGNEKASMVGYPSKYQKCISVTSVDGAYTPAIYTNYGIGADIAAPGGDRVYHARDDRGMILSTVPPSNNDGNKYGYMEGTSMACPMVSGVAALGLSYASKLKKHFKAEEFTRLLLESTTPIEPHLQGEKIVNYVDQDGNIVPRPMDLTKYQKKMGRGVANAEALLAAIDKNGTPMRIPNFTIKKGESISSNLADYFIGGSTKNFTIEVADQSIATATMDGSKLDITAIKLGTTTIKVKAEGVDQKILVIVNNSSSDNWL